jgi:hypothetical protein
MLDEQETGVLKHRRSRLRRGPNVKQVLEHRGRKYSIELADVGRDLVECSKLGLESRGLQVRDVRGRRVDADHVPLAQCTKNLEQPATGTADIHDAGSADRRVEGANRLSYRIQILSRSAAGPLFGRTARIIGGLQPAIT